MPGWLLRLTEINGYGRPLAIERIAGLQRGRVPSAREAVVEALAYVTGTDPSRVDRIVPQRIGPSFRRTIIPSLRLPRTMFDAKPKFCTECLRERKVLPAVWDLTAWAACPIHGCLLSDRCPACDEPVSWLRASTDRCGEKGCRGLLSDGPVRPADDTLVALSRLLAARIGVPGGEGGSPIGPPLAELGSEDVFLLVGRLGRLASPNGGSDGPRDAPALMAAKLLTAWPENFHDFVRSQATPPETHAHATKAYPRITLLLHRDKRLGAISDAARNFVTRAFLTAIPETPLKHFAGAVAKETLASSWVSLRATAKLLGMHWRSVTRLAREGALRSTTVTTNSNTFLYLDRADVRRMAARTPSPSNLRNRFESGELIKKAEAGRRLNISVAFVRALADAGFLIETRRIAGSHRALIDSGSVVQILARLTEAAVSQPMPIPEGPVLDLLQVVQTRKGLTLEDLLRRIEDGELRPDLYDSTKEGLRAYLFDRSNLSGLDADLRRKRGVLTVPEAATALVCSGIDVKRLVWAGLLQGNVYANEIECISLAEVRARYASGRELAGSLCTKPYKIERMLRDRGHLPVLAQANRRKQCSFWDRSMAAGVLVVPG